MRWASSVPDDPLLAVKVPKRSRISLNCEDDHAVDASQKHPGWRANQLPVQLPPSLAFETQVVALSPACVRFKGGVVCELPAIPLGSVQAGAGTAWQTSRLLVSPLIRACRKPHILVWPGLRVLSPAMAHHARTISLFREV